MGFLGKALKSAIVVKIVDEARKPHNQQKVKDAVQQLRNRGKGGATGPGSRRPR